MDFWVQNKMKAVKHLTMKWPTIVTANLYIWALTFTGLWININHQNQNMRVLRIQLLEPNNSAGVKVTLYQQLYLLVHRIDGFFPRHRPLFESNILTYNSVWPPRQAFISGMRRRSRGRKFETKYSHCIPCRLLPNSDSYYFCFTFFHARRGTEWYVGN